MENYQTIHNETEKKILDYIDTYDKYYHKFPTMDNVEKNTGKSRHDIKVAYNILVSKGELGRNSSRYWRIKESDRGQSQTEISNVQGGISGKPIIDKIIAFMDAVVTGFIQIVRILLLPIAMSCIAISIYYSQIWWCETTPIAWALLITTTFSLFLTIAFQIIILCFKFHKYLMGLIFAFLWLIIFAFTVISIVAGQYDSRIKIEKRNEIQIAKSNQEKTEFSLLTTNQKFIELQIQSKIKQIEGISQGLDKNKSGLTDELARLKEYNEYNTSNLLKKLNTELNDLNTDLSANLTAQQTYLDTHQKTGDEEQIQEKSFYVWMSEIFGIPANIIAFWVSVIPSLFLDIISSLCIAAFIFLGGKSETRKEQKSKNFLFPNIISFIKNRFIKQDANS